MEKKKLNIFFIVDSLTCFSCAGPRDSPCYLGDATSSDLVYTNCPDATHCYATSASKFDFKFLRPYFVIKTIFNSYYL